MTTVLDALLSRRSVPTAALTEPGPSDAELDQILQTAQRAADHGHMRPWRFHVVRDKFRAAYVDMLLDALQELRPDTPGAKIAQKRTAYAGVPMAIAVGVEIRDNPRVPDIEQIIAAGGAVQNILNAAHSFGYGAILLSGPAIEHPRVKASLGLKERDYFLGTVFLGTVRVAPQLDVADTAGTVFEWKAPA